MSGDSGGVPQEQKRARERRMRHSAKAQVQHAEMLLDKYRARAAKILHAEGLHGGADTKKQSAYVYKILRHRETGVRVRVLDTKAPDAPKTVGHFVHRYAVECETHGTEGASFEKVGAAMKAARGSAEWCSQCAGLMSAKPKARNRSRTTTKHLATRHTRVRRRDDIWP